VALCWNEELAALSRQYNNANVLALPARFISYDLAEKLLLLGNYWKNPLAVSHLSTLN